MYQELVRLYGACCALDSSMLKRLQFWSHELHASIPPLRNKAEKISSLSDFVFQRLFLTPNPRHIIVDWGQAMQERKCNPFMLAVLYGYFCEAAGLNCVLLNDSSYRYAKFNGEGIFDLHNGGTPLSGSQILESLKQKCGQTSLEPLSPTELRTTLYKEILKGHFTKSNWEQVITALDMRRKDRLGSPRDFTIYAFVYEKLGNKEMALRYLKRYLSFVPDLGLPPDLTEKYHELHFDQIESILSKMEPLPFES